MELKRRVPTADPRNMRGTVRHHASTGMCEITQ